MTQKKMVYPKKAKRMLQVRECTVAICNNNNPASVLLSAFLFWYDYPRNGDTCQDGKFTICRTQTDIEHAACNQIDVKTIHDTAVPFLQLFGYLTVKEKMNGNIYIIDIDRVIAAFAAFEGGDKSLRDFLKSSLQLESALIIIPQNELEATLNNKRQLYLQLERVLIATRADSNCKRGRKPKREAALEAEKKHTETLETLEITRERENLTQTAIPPLASSDASLVVVAQKQETLLPQEKPVVPPTTQVALLAVPLTEPDMTGAWNTEKCVQYAEWCNGKRYTDIMRPQQLAAAQSIHVKHKTLTLQQFKQAYDERNDAWWQEKKKGKLHVSDMHAKGNSGVDRVSEMLERIEGRTTRKVIPMLTTSQQSVDYRNIMPPRLPSREQRKREVV